MQIIGIKLLLPNTRSLADVTPATEHHQNTYAAVQLGSHVVVIGCRTARYIRNHHRNSFKSIWYPPLKPHVPQLGKASHPARVLHTTSHRSRHARHPMHGMPAITRAVSHQHRHMPFCNFPCSQVTSARATLRGIRASELPRKSNKQPTCNPRQAVACLRG